MLSLFGLVKANTETTNLKMSNLASVVYLSTFDQFVIFKMAIRTNFFNNEVTWLSAFLLVPS